MQRAAMTLAVLVLFLSALAASAPATLLDARLSALTQGRLRLAAATGTVWNGNAVLTNAAGEWSVPIGWHLAPAPLLRGSTNIVLTAPVSGLTPGPTPGPKPRGNVQWQDENAAFENLALTIPAAAISGTLAARDTLALGGRITLDAPSLQWSGGHGTGSVTVRWQGARLAGNGGVVNLGNVALDLAPRGDQLAGRITNTGGDLRLDGETFIGSQGAGIDVALTPAPSTPRELTRVLAALGTPDVNGVVRVQWRGTVR
jgi:general secretion pathway protein N